MLPPPRGTRRLSRRSGAEWLLVWVLMTLVVEISPPVWTVTCQAWGADTAADSQSQAPVMPRIASPGENPQENQPKGEVISPQEEAIPAKVYRYAQRLIREHDRDGDGKLSRLEWGQHSGFLTSDSDLDGRVRLEELVGRIAAYGRHRRIRLMAPMFESDDSLPSLLNPTTEAVPPMSPDAAAMTDNGPTPEARVVASAAAGGALGAGTVDNRGNGGESEKKEGGEKPERRETKFVVSAARRPEGLPSWFVDKDSDGDGQLSMAEFAPKPTGASLADFARYDRNGDGVITAGEYLRAVKSAAAEKSP